MLYYLWTCLAWAGVGLTGNLVVAVALLETANRPGSRPPNSGRLIPLAARI